MPRAFGHEKTKKLYLEEWLPLPPEDRVPLTKENFAKLHKVARKTLTFWEKKHQRAIDEYDPIVYLRSRTKETDEALIESCLKGNAQNQKLLNQLIGRLVEKSEVSAKIELSADEITRRNLEAERQLREQGYRVEEMPKKLPVLHDKLCLDTGQGETSDN